MASIKRSHPHATLNHSLVYRSWLGLPFDLSRIVLPHSARSHMSAVKHDWLSHVSPALCVIVDTCFSFIKITQ